MTQRKIEHLPQKAGHSKKTNGRSLFGVGPLINELIHALDYLVNAIDENENQLIPREKHLVDDKCHEFIDRNMHSKVHSRN